MDFHEFSDAAVDADSLSFAEVSFVILGRNALLVTRLRQPAERQRMGLMAFVLVRNHQDFITCCISQSSSLSPC